MNPFAIKHDARTCILIGLAVSLAVVVGCQKAPQPKPMRDAYNPEIDVRLSGFDDRWASPTNQPDSTLLTLVSPDRDGSVRITVGEEEAGVNLVAKVDEHREQFSARRDGTYSGAQELAGPMGVAFYSRGRFILDDQMTEETIIVALHPRSSRAIQLTYRYPAGDDSSERVSELIELFASVE